jgi:hypothetical protein
MFGLVLLQTLSQATHFAYTLDGFPYQIFLEHTVPLDIQQVVTHDGV